MILTSSELPVLDPSLLGEKLPRRTDVGLRTEAFSSFLGEKVSLRADLGLRTAAISGGSFKGGARRGRMASSCMQW